MTNRVVTVRCTENIRNSWCRKSWLTGNLMVQHPRQVTVSAWQWDSAVTLAPEVSLPLLRLQGAWKIEMEMEVSLSTCDNPHVLLYVLLRGTVWTCHDKYTVCLTIWCWSLWPVTNLLHWIFTFTHLTDLIVNTELRKKLKSILRRYACLLPCLEVGWQWSNLLKLEGNCQQTLSSCWARKVSIGIFSQWVKGKYSISFHSELYGCLVHSFPRKKVFSFSYSMDELF